MPGLSVIRRYFGSALSGAAGFAAGTATAPVLHPEVHELENLAWEKYKSRRIDPGTAAAIVAEDVDSKPWGEKEAGYSGIDSGRFDKLLGEALNAPGSGQLFELWRRGAVTDAQFVHGLRKAKLEPEWDAPLMKLHDVLLSSEELAMMQQQGFVDQTRADQEGALQGVTSERQQLRYEASGLPPGVETGLELLRRSIIDEATFAQIVREGHTKTKYTDVLTQLRARVLSAATYATLYLKGWITQSERDAGGALTGYTPEQMDLLYKEHGRPATTHQVFIGNRRGGHIGDPTTGIDPDFLRAVIQSDIRPEYAPVLWAQRYTYPAAFVLRGLTQSGDITEAQAEQILLFEGWEPALAKQVAAKWSKGTTAASKEATASDLLALYDGGKLDHAAVIGDLEALGYPADEAQRKVDVIEARRVVGAKQAAIGDLHTKYKKAELSNVKAETALTTLGLTPAGASAIVAAWGAYLTAEGLTAPA